MDGLPRSLRIGVTRSKRTAYVKRKTCALELVSLASLVTAILLLRDGIRDDPLLFVVKQGMARLKAQKLRLVR